MQRDVLTHPLTEWSTDEPNERNVRGIFRVLRDVRYSGPNRHNTF